MSERRQAFGPINGHLKRDCWLGRNNLKGTQGDSMIALLSCAGHNLRVILKRLTNSCVQILCCSIFHLNRSLLDAEYGFAALNAA